MPGPVTNYNLTTSSTTVHMSWHLPQLHVRCVKFYKIHSVGPIEWSPEQQTTIDIDTEDTYVKITNLEPCGNYNLTLSSVSLSGNVTVPTNVRYLMSEDGKEEFLSLNFVRKFIISFINIKLLAF